MQDKSYTGSNPHEGGGSEWKRQAASVAEDAKTALSVTHHSSERAEA
jgi:hypothetical protein